MPALLGLTCLHTEHRIVIRQGSTVIVPKGLPHGRDSATVKKPNTRLESDLAGHTRAECGRSEHRTLARYLRQLATWRLTIYKAAVSAEATR